MELFDNKWILHEKLKFWLKSSDFIQHLNVLRNKHSEYTAFFLKIRHFADDIFTCICLNSIYFIFSILNQIYHGLFIVAQLTISEGHQWWPIPLMHLCAKMIHSVNAKSFAVFPMPETRNDFEIIYFSTVIIFILLFNCIDMVIFRFCARGECLHKIHDNKKYVFHYSDVIMSEMVPQITGVSFVCSTVGSSTDQRKYQSSTSLVFVTEGNPPVTGGFPQ